MQRIALTFMAIVFVLAMAEPATAQIIRKCPPDSVKVGNTCVDTYEASVWLVPDPTGTGKSLVKKIENGKATLTDLLAAGAVQLGCTTAPFSATAYPTNFPADGNWTPFLNSVPPTPGVYAVSVAGTLPTTCTTQFQAAQACALSGRRLIRNDEWQRAAAGTPDPGFDNGLTTCVTNSLTASPVNTGARSSCVSVWGAHDMVGNVWEWVSDWTDRALGSTDWTSSSQTGIVGGDYSGWGGPGESGATSTLDPYSLPAAPFRGGDWGQGTFAGVFAVNAILDPSYAIPNIGFRCVR